jgi:hypothetical protein
MKTALAIMFGFTMAIYAQDMPPGDALKAELAAKKVLAERTANQTFEFVGGQLLGGNPVKGAPYSAEAVNQTTQTLADGSHIVNQSSSVLYRDSEGRERREESIGKLGVWNAEGAPVKTIFISDPVAKVSYTLDPNTHSAQKMPASMMIAASKAGETVALHTVTAQASMPALPGPVAGGERVFFYSRTTTAESAKSPGKVEVLGRQMIEGVQAEGTRTTVTIPAGQIGNERDINIVSERWFSPELQVTVLSKHTDPRMGETVYKLTNVNRAEPLHSMFEVPPDYTVTESPMMRVRRPAGKEEQN